MKNTIKEKSIKTGAKAMLAQSYHVLGYKRY